MRSKISKRRHVSVSKPREEFSAFPYSPPPTGTWAALTEQEPERSQAMAARVEELCIKMQSKNLSIRAFTSSRRIFTTTII